MSILTLSKITLAPGGHSLFRGLDWSLEPGRCTGLVGANGSGKSSLLRVVAGELTVDEGEVARRRGLSIGYLPQDLDFLPTESRTRLLDVALAQPARLVAVEEELARIELSLAREDVYFDEAKLARVLARQEAALARWEELGGAGRASTVRELLARFGLGEDDWDRPVETLSGGEKKLVAITALAADAPDLLLLDEPDNHLDLAAKARLEAFLQSYAGAVVVVSHDRYLLDAVVDEIAELEAGQLSLHTGTYSRYASERALRRLHQQRAHAAQQKEIARIETTIARFELWASMVVNERHAKQARSRRRALDKMDERGEIIAAVRESKRMGLVLGGGRGSKNAVELRSLSMGFGDDLLFVDLNLLVRHGERVGIVGPNGCGKSVLFRLLREQLEPLEGEIRIGAGCQPGYYTQEHERLEPWLARSPLELVRDVQPMSEGAATAFLMRFLFQYDQLRCPIGVLSGGERSRLQLACLMLERPNLLLLDEPTNNLDIPSAEVLEEALDDFEGALIVISHDRYFLDKAVDRVVDWSSGDLVCSEGGYSDYASAIGLIE